MPLCWEGEEDGATVGVRVFRNQWSVRVRILLVSLSIVFKWSRILTLIHEQCKRFAFHFFSYNHDLDYSTHAGTYLVEWCSRPQKICTRTWRQRSFASCLVAGSTLEITLVWARALIWKPSLHTQKNNKNNVTCSKRTRTHTHTKNIATSRNC